MENNDKIQISHNLAKTLFISCIHFLFKVVNGIILELGTQMESVIILK
jgi:hypothetical protein